MYRLIGFFIIGILMISCDSDLLTGNFKVGSDLIEISNKVVLIDSLTVDVSTINFDSLVTSGSGRILVGQYEDPIFGNIKSVSYMQLNATNYKLENTNSETESSTYVYDSIAIILRYDRYYYGDTTNVQNINIHRLVQKLKPNDDTEDFYNNSTLQYDSNSIGFKTFKPKPNEKDSINIPLSDVFGNEIFQKLKNNDFSDQNQFLEYFKGLVIIPSAASSSCVIGFNLKSVLRLYYSKAQDSEESESLIKDFTVSEVNKQFNNITLNRTGTILQNLPPSWDVLPSKTTNNVAFIQSGTGIACRVNFPFIRQLKYISEHGAIVDAELILKPVKNTYSKLYPFKDSLQVYVCDQLNRISGTLINDEGDQVFAKIDETDDEFNENLGYKLSIGTFLQKEMIKEKEKKSSLIFTFPNVSNGVERVNLGNQNNIENKLKLKIYYIAY